MNRTEPIAQLTEPADAATPGLKNLKRDTMMSKSLLDLNPGETAIIQDVSRANGAATNLMEMGLTAGTPVRLVKFAPLGDPVELKVRGYHLSIRKSEARDIAVLQNRD